MQSLSGTVVNLKETNKVPKWKKDATPCLNLIMEVSKQMD
jgi:hypothetical protein